MPQAIQAIVRGIRNSRSEYGVDGSRKIAATIHVADAALRPAIDAEGAVIALLARVDPTRLSVTGEMSSQEQPGDQIQIVVSEGLQVTVPMAGGH